MSSLHTLWRWFSADLRWLPVVCVARVVHASTQGVLIWCAGCGRNYHQGGLFVAIGRNDALHTPSAGVLVCYAAALRYCSSSTASVWYSPGHVLQQQPCEGLLSAAAAIGAASKSFVVQEHVALQACCSGCCLIMC